MDCVWRAIGVKLFSVLGFKRLVTLFVFLKYSVDFMKSIDWQYIRVEEGNQLGSYRWGPGELQG